MATAAIGAGASVLGGLLGGKGASSAAKEQAKAQQAALANEQAQFATISNDASPTIAAGSSATQQLLRLLGLGDSNTGTSASPYTAEQQQQGAISAIQNGPEYTSEFNSGLNAINQSAAATGGLRGGNTALAQSDFGSTLLNSLIQQSIGNLSGVTATGTSALGTLASAGSSNTAQQSATQTALGGANATAAASPYAALQGILSGLGSASGTSSSSGIYNGTSAFPSAAYGW